MTVANADVRIIYNKGSNAWLTAGRCGCIFTKRIGRWSQRNDAGRRVARGVGGALHHADHLHGTTDKNTNTANTIKCTAPWRTVARPPARVTTLISQVSP